MQDREFSPESAEDIIELLDIVEPSAEVSDSTAADAADIASDDTLELTDSIMSDVVCDGSADDDASQEADAEACAEEVDVTSDESEEEQGMLDEASEEDSTVCEEDSSLALPADEPAAPCASSDADFCRLIAAEFDERFRLLEERRDAELDILRKRLEASESRCAALSDEVETLRQQLAQCSSLFLEDPSVRLSLEEMVSRMVELHTPVSSADEIEDEEEGSALPSDMSEERDPLDDAAEAVESDDTEKDDDAAPACAEEESASRQVIIETIEELARHVGVLEERVADWELRCEQEAALAAARVIREEIAALKAGAARLGR